MQQPASNRTTDPSHKEEAPITELEPTNEPKETEAPAKGKKVLGKKQSKPARKTTAKSSKAQQPDNEDEDEDAVPALTKVIGRRLALIREELGQHRPGHSLSQNQVAMESGLTQNMVWRLERGLSRNDGLLKLLRYYEKHGYNISWILTEQNFAVSKLLVQQLTVNVDSNYLRLIHRQVEKVVSIQEKASQAMSDLQALLQDMKSGK